MLETMPRASDRRWYLGAIPAWAFIGMYLPGCSCHADTIIVFYTGMLAVFDGVMRSGIDPTATERLDKLMQATELLVLTGFVTAAVMLSVILMQQSLPPLQTVLGISIVGVQWYVIGSGITASLVKQYDRSGHPAAS